MKRAIAILMILSAFAVMLVGGACGGGGAIKADSTLQDAMKIVPDDWNIFCYLNAKEMRSDIEEPSGLSDLWNWGEESLESLSTAADLNPEEWPLSMDNIDYLAISAGGFQQNEAASMVFIIGGTFNLSTISTYLENFHTNFPDAGVEFTKDTYNGVETWAPDIEQNYTWQENPDVLIALHPNRPIALVGNTEGIKDCINVIKGPGDYDSMLGNEGVQNIAGRFGDSVFAMIVDGDVDTPDDTYTGAPDYPESFDGTLGYGFKRVDDKLTLELFAEMNDWSEWQEFLISEMPDSEYLSNNFGGSYYGRGEKEARLTEKMTVQQAVMTCMIDNKLGAALPNPVDIIATNNMGAFPDNSTIITQKVADPNGTLYQAADKGGYYLYNHDLIADNAAIGLVKYVDRQTTVYYYTVDSDGTVHQYEFGTVPNSANPEIID